MKWLDKIRRCLRSRWTPPPPPGTAADTQVLEARLEDARARRQDTVHRAPEVSRLTSKLTREAQINHFGEAIDVAMQKRRS